MSFASDAVLRALTGTFCRIDWPDIAALPRKGPYILVTNHVNFLEIPIIRSRLPHHRMTGFVKAETWDNPAMSWLFSGWRAIPINRNTTDFHALRAGLDALREGWILAIAPEGTRSRDGVLRQAHTGVATMAVRSGAVILPLVCWGQEDFGGCIKRGRRTDVHLRAGRPFRVRSSSPRPGHEERTEITSQIMLQLAALLPEAKRGHYAGAGPARTDLLAFGW